MISTIKYSVYFMLLFALPFNVATMEERNIQQKMGGISVNHRVKRDGGIITGAVIGGLFTLANTAAGTFPGANFGTGSKGGCQWIGSAPFCHGGCNENDGFTQERRTGGGFGGNLRINGRYFGDSCLSGTKSLCCKSMAQNNVWDGQWENHSTNDKIRCLTYKIESRCGAKLECYSDNLDYTWKFNIVGSNCNVVETTGTKSYNGCRGDAKYGLIIFRSHSGNCGKYFDGVKYYKVE